LTFWFFGLGISTLEVAVGDLAGEDRLEVQIKRRILWDRNGNIITFVLSKNHVCQHKTFSRVEPLTTS
jgi:hypothetical protein